MSTVITKKKQWKRLQRCLNCKNAKCIQGCPVSINIPGFIQQVKEGNIEEAYQDHRQVFMHFRLSVDVYVRRRSQCEGKCIRGIKGEPVSIGKLERFVADYALENDIKPAKPETTEWYIKLQLSVLVRPDLHAPETLQSLVMK